MQNLYVSVLTCMYEYIKSSTFTRFSRESLIQKEALKPRSVHKQNLFLIKKKKQLRMEVFFVRVVGMSLVLYSGANSVKARI